MPQWVKELDLGKMFQSKYHKKSDQASELKQPNRNFVLLSLLCSIKLTWLLIMLQLEKEIP